MRVKSLLLMMCLGVAACAPAPDAGREPVVTLGNQASETAEDTPIVTAPPPSPEDELKGTYWPPAKLEVGSARISCETDYAAHGDGEPLLSLEFFSLVDALTPCRPGGTVRLRYEGKIGAGFTALVQRVGAMADRMDIPTRVLDISSTGGHVEEAIRAGDAMADAGWDIWVRRESFCHSACVLVLAGGDTRAIEGKVGIHRLIRDRSRATTRAELRAELKEVHGDVREYLERNGGATAVADMMMIVPNHDLRILSEQELKRFGLAGTNAAQADLDRIVTGRKCGQAFVRRRDAFQREFDRQCLAPGQASADTLDCGLALRAEFGFPDNRCPDESPLARQVRERERAFAEAAREAAGEEQAGTGEEAAAAEDDRKRSGHAVTRAGAR